MPYKYRIFDSFEEIEVSEETYDIYEDAECAAQQWLSDYSTGADVLALANEEYSDPDDADYEIIEL